MNTGSASGAEAAPGTPSRVLVWDAPVRVFHWLMALAFAGAWLTAESDRWYAVHVTLGSTLAGLVVFRIVWGLLGTRHARFAHFVRGPAAVARYLGSLLRGRPEHHVGHNPAGALAILALLLLAAGITATGLAMEFSLAGRWLEKLHEGAAKLMLALVGLHIAAVVISSWLHRENLTAAMVNGRKRALPQDGIRRAWRGVAALMLVSVLGFWWLQWHAAPVGDVVASLQGGWRTMAAHDDDD